jgi:PKD repeat protein
MHSLSSLNSLDNVQFRFKLWAIEARTGFAIDDFEICDAPISGFDYLASGGEVVFNDTSINGSNYEWVFSDGQSSSDQNPTITFQQDTIDVIQIVTNDCFTDTSHKTIYTVGINDIVLNDIKIYPNPFKNQLRIDNEKLVINKIEIFDVTGKEVNFEKSGDKNIVISTSNWDNGIYFLHLRIKNATFVKKIVK